MHGNPAGEAERDEMTEPQVAARYEAWREPVTPLPDARGGEGGLRWRWRWEDVERMDRRKRRRKLKSFALFLSPNQPNILLF